MERKEPGSGEVLVASLKEKFRRKVPSRILRILLIVCVALLLCAAIVGIIFGCIAIGTCRADAAPAQNASQPIDSVVSRPGVLSEDVALTRPTEAPTEPPVQAQETAPDETPEPLDTPTAEPVEVTTNLLNGKTYQKGDTDPLIATVQSALMDLGYMDSDEPTEYFGNQTLDALTTFQRHNDLTPDGILGETTYARLFDGTAKEYVMQEGDEGDDVKEVQDRLYELGYLDKGSRTSTFGEKTAAAVRAFQSANKLKVDGKVGTKTLNRLYSSDVVGNVFKSGDTDEQIKQYQQRLIKLGYLPSSYEVKGKMDSKTVSAIKTFQEANGLVRDGCLGPATMEQILSKHAVEYAMRLGMSGSNIKNAQSRLHKLGYLRSSQVTGYYGETTEEAVKSFQKRNSISQSGEIDDKTLDKLNSDKAKAAPTKATPKPTATPKPGTTPKPGKTTPKPSSGSSSSSKGVEKFISIAQSKLGCKYVRGAKGPNSFDCSGFVFWCLNQAGVKQGYMTSIAWRNCSKYRRINSMSDLKRGDVLVFKGKSMETGHVGIYLGDGKMIDASSGAGQVRITDKSILKSTYWQEHFLMAYRIWG